MKKKNKTQRESIDQSKKMNLDSLKKQVQNVSLYDVKSVVRKVQNGK